MNALVIDTSVYISFFSRDDIYALQSSHFFSTIISTPVQIIHPALVIAEVATILYKKKKTDVREIIEHLYQERVIDLDEETVDRCLEVFDHIVDLELKTSDLVIAVTAQRANATLVTWDKQLLSQAKKICTVMSPQQYCQSALK